VTWPARRDATRLDLAGGRTGAAPRSAACCAATATAWCRLRRCSRRGRRARRLHARGRRGGRTARTEL